MAKDRRRFAPDIYELAECRAGFSVRTTSLPARESGGLVNSYPIAGQSQHDLADKPDAVTVQHGRESSCSPPDVSGFLACGEWAGAAQRAGR